MILFLSILYIIWSIAIGISIGWLIGRINELERRYRRMIMDINSLRHNQNTIVLTIKELHRELRKRDKSLKRQIRIPIPEKE